MLKNLVKKVDNIQEQMETCSREIKIILRDKLKY